MEDNNKFLRARDVAHILDCSPDDLYPLINAGELKAHKIGRLWKFRLDDVLTYKEQSEGKPAQNEKRGKLNAKNVGVLNSSGRY